MALDKYRKSFNYEIITPTGLVAKGLAVSVSLPAEDGQIGILGGRSPLATEIGAGLLHAQKTDGMHEEYFIAGGFAQVREDWLTILAEQCLPLEWIDPRQVYAELDRARQMPKDTPAAAELRAQAVATARKKFNLAQEFHRGGQEGPAWRRIGGSRQSKEGNCPKECG